MVTVLNYLNKVQSRNTYIRRRVYNESDLVACIRTMYVNKNAPIIFTLASYNLFTGHIKQMDITRT